jgi:hypothetical protein
MKSLFNRICEKFRNDSIIVIVSGLPRSGTSMMMRMIEAGGVEVVTDNIRMADVDNPQGYYEFEKVKRIKNDSSWLKGCRNKAFKMVSELLYHLPGNEKYKVVFMRRDMDEMLASQQKMLENLKKSSSSVSNDEMKIIYGKHLRKLKQWLEEQENIDVLYISFNDVIRNPLENAEKVNDFLGGNLNMKKMSHVVEEALYRQRK